MQKTYAYQKSKCSEQDIENVRSAIKSLPSEFTAQQAMSAVCGLRGVADSWDVLNALDHLVMASEIVELTAGTDCMGQYRRYRKAGI